MPACIALVPCAVSWLPSLGRITSALTFWLIRVSIAAICWVMSLVGFTGENVTSGNFSAAACALAAMAAIQPWSAAGADKPMVTARPGAELGPAAAPPLGAGGGAACGVLLVHAASAAPAPTARAPERKPRRARKRAVSVGSGIVALLSSWGNGGQVSERRARVWNSTAATMIRPFAMFWTS